jgi:hypothetical protein
MTGERDNRGQLADEQPSAAGQAWDDDMPGDPACWLRRVCPACGTLADVDPPTTCQRCHAAIPGSDV